MSGKLVTVLQFATFIALLRFPDRRHARALWLVGVGVAVFGRRLHPRALARARAVIDAIRSLAASRLIVLSRRRSSPRACAGGAAARTATVRRVSRWTRSTGTARRSQAGLGLTCRWASTCVSPRSAAVGPQWRDAQDDAGRTNRRDRALSARPVSCRCRSRLSLGGGVSVPYRAATP